MKGAKLIILVLVAVLICVGAWFMLRPRAVTGPALAEMLPADTLLSIELINLDQTIEEFKTSRLGEKLKEVDINSVLQAFNAPAEQIEKINKLKDSILSTVDSVVFKELFGGDAVIALLPFNIRSEEGFEKILSSIVLVSRTKHRAAVVEFISMVISKHLETQTHQLHDYEITSLMTEGGFTVYYGIVDDLLIATFDLDTMIACLELRKANEASLANTRYYQDLSGRVFTGDSTIFCFNNTKKLYENLVENITAFSDKEDEKVNEVLEGFKNMEGFDAIAYSSSRDGGDLIRDRALLVFDKSRMPPVYARMYSFEPEENKTLGMVPENSMVYYWSNSLDASILKDLYLDELKLDDAAIERIETEFLSNTGISLDKAAGAFGNQAGFFISDIKTGGLFPIPEIGILLQIKDQNTAEKLISTLFQKPGMRLEQENVDDVTIKYMILPMGADIQPAYAFYNGFCVVSINRQMIKEIMRMDKAGSGIAAAQAFKEGQKGMTDKNNAVSFIRIDPLLDKIKAVAEWGRNMGAMANPEAVEKGTVVLNNLVYPVLDGLKDYKSFSARTVIRNGEIEVLSCTNIER